MTVPGREDLLERLAIRELLERYMRYNDDGDLDRMLALFDDDAVFQVVGRVARGHEELRAFFTVAGYVEGKPRWTDDGGLFLQPRSAHISSNPVIDVDGANATAESEFLVVGRDEEGRSKVQLVGRYRDRLRRLADGRWVFTSRTGVSVARPGEADRDTEWQRALARMDPAERQNLRT